MYKVEFTKTALKQLPNLRSVGLAHKAKALVELLAQDPYRTPPPYEKLIGDLKGSYSRRLNVQHRLVYQVFEEFSADLDKLSESFAELFKCYASDPYSALNLIDIHLRNAFVVYVADKARKVYSDGNLWGNFFKDIGIHDAGAQSMFKQVFVNHINHLVKPLYARDEEANYYFYTSILHGGQSMYACTELLGKSILTLAKKRPRATLVLAEKWMGIPL